MEEKKVVGESDVLGDEERIRTVEEEVTLVDNQTLEQYLEEAQLVKKVMNKVRTKMSKAMNGTFGRVSSSLQLQQQGVFGGGRRLG